MHSIEVVARRRAEFDRVTRVLLPPWETIATADNTRSLLEVAGSLRIPIPASYELGAFASLAELAAAIRYPVIVKTGIEGGLRPADRYGIAHDAASFQRLVTRLQRITQNPLIQELIPGTIIGFEAIYDNHGRMVASFSHRRLRQYPLSGGPSTFCESCYHPAVEEYGRKLLDHLQWRGVAMVEFMLDHRDGIPKLMEINPRPWGSMALPIRAGVDFPWLNFRLAMNEQVAPTPRLQTHTRLRYLINDLQAAVATARGRSFLTKLRIAASFLDPRVKEGVLMLTDIRPSLAYLFKGLKRALRGHQPLA
jgi:predicted ATP-grasp superfamily ATP-dependent carboligase